jgi:hypothetical protein
VDPRAVLDDVEKRKFFILPGLELRPPRLSSPQPVAIPITLSRLLVAVIIIIIIIFIFWNSPVVGNVSEEPTGSIFVV